LARSGDRAVLGPSTDGGYYLFGLKFADRRMFEDITLSTERVAEQTLTRAREIDLDVHMLPAWYDVDDIDGLHRLQAELRDCAAKAAPQDLVAPHRAVHAAKLMNELARDRDFGRLGARAFETDEIRA